MAANPPAGYPRLSPYLLYEDVSAALAFLQRAFGFAETFHLNGKDGAITHAEMKLADAHIMLGCPGPQYRNPRHLGGSTQYVHVYVDQIDAHAARARAAGARIVQEPADQSYGDRRYIAEDLEGHMWAFAEHLRDVAPQDMQG